MILLRLLAGQLREPTARPAAALAATAATLAAPAAALAADLAVPGSFFRAPWMKTKM